MKNSLSLYLHMRKVHHREDYVRLRLTKMPGQNLQCRKCLWYFVFKVNDNHVCRTNRDEAIRSGFEIEIFAGSMFSNRIRKFISANDGIIITNKVF